MMLQIAIWLALGYNFQTQIWRPLRDIVIIIFAIINILLDSSEGLEHSTYKLTIGDLLYVSEHILNAAV